MKLTEGIVKADRIRIEEILRSTGFFYEFEITTALEIAETTLEKGMEKSGYYWITASDEEGMAGFCNFGKNDFSTHSWDLYWIAVHQDARNKKVGSALLKAVEDAVIRKGGKILWIETSGRPQYASTEGFYKRNGYELQASLKDFYGPGDPKQIYARVLK